MTLKIGDKVRGNGRGVPRAGITYEVVGLAKSGSAAYPLRFKNLEYGNEFDGSEREVEKIEDPTPKFKVGDRVRLPDWVHTEKVGTVTRVESRTQTVEVLPDGDVQYSAGCAETPGAGSFDFPAVTKIASGVPFKPEHGDKVVNLKTGREGVVLMGQVWDKDIFSRARPVPVKALVEYEEHHAGTYDLIKKDAPW